MATPQNIVGPHVRKLRYQKELTQDMLAARCAQFGWDLSRGTLAKIESQLRCVTDWEAVILTNALGVPLDAIFPSKLTPSRKSS